MTDETRTESAKGAVADAADTATPAGINIGDAAADHKDDPDPVKDVAMARIDSLEEIVTGLKETVENMAATAVAQTSPEGEVLEPDTTPAGTPWTHRKLFG